MKITRKFTTAGTDVYSTVKWVNRSSKITNPDGSVVFKMDDASVPESWSQLATDIMVSKYFRKAGVPLEGPDGQPLKDEHGKIKTGPEKSARQVIHRLAGCWRHWGETHGYFDTAEDASAFYDELAHMLVHQVAAPNSPQWFNTGLNFAYGITGPAQGHYVVDPKSGEVKLADDAYTHPQPHACFIQSVRDDLVNEGGIMDLWTREARLFKYGSGTGTNFSHLRAENEPLSGGGKSSGLMSWLRIGDRAAGAIKSGGTTRRAAKMVCLDMDHPDIETFVNWKVREEIKVQAMVEGLKVLKEHDPATAATCEKLRLNLDFDFNGEAYATVSGQNSNNSIRIPDEFFDAVDKGAEWKTTWRTSTKPARTFDARTLWDEIAFAAWRCADPGVQYDTTINAWHTCPSAGRINASNPCVTGDTLVATTAGLRRIRDLVGQSAEVIDADGKPSFVDRIFKTGTKPVFQLKTRSGYSLKLTADHKVLTANRGDVRAAELTLDDVVILKGAGFGLDFLPPQAAELLGAAVGDGCITRGQSQDHFFVTLGEGERAVAEDLRSHIDWCKNWLNEGDARSTRPTSVITTATGVRVQTSVDKLLSLFTRFAALDRGSQRKALTDAAFALDRATLAALLRGLFTTDGTVADYSDKSQYVALDSTSLALLRQVQQLLLSFGIKAKVYENRRALDQATTLLPDGRGGTAEYPVTQIHSLRISRSSRVRFQQHIGFMASSPKAARLAALNARLGAYTDRMLDRVASLTACGTEDVYDLTEPRTHHFVAGGIVVHNCSEYMFLDNTACNLASINLITLYDSQTRQFDIEKYEHAIDLWTIVLEISVLMAAFPSEEIARLSYRYRTLGLGYANLGAMLMQAGIAYDSEEGRTLCAMLSALLTGRSYRMSALMAKEHGPFPGYEDDAAPMLRVIRNHRLAAHGEARTSGRYEHLRIRPLPIDHALATSGRILVKNAPHLLERSVIAWDDALELGIKHGYRNAQTTVIAPTGTIGLLMDCDTTGIEPDFALVKFKKLAGGGYFKIANGSVRPALEALGYPDRHIRDIMVYLLGTLTVDVPVTAGAPALRGSTPVTLKRLLLDAGLNDADLARINDALPGLFELSFGFTALTLGEETLKRIGIDPAAAEADPSWNLLKHLGLTKDQIDALNDTICGRQTVEGAPHLKAEHLPVFDCANPCGKYGKRFIAPEGHIRMMAAAQPFITGAISKTINLPPSATIDDIKEAYRLSWELGLKANALYRDGCKLSQPLNTSAQSTNAAVKQEEAVAAEEAGEQVVTQHVEELVRIVERPMRRRLPDTRASITHKFNIAGHEGYLTVGLYEDGMPGELFITMAKEGSTIGGLMDALGTATSVALQYGVPVESLVTKFTHQRFEPAGMTTNADIPFAKSLVDYIFRWMGMQFIPGYKERNAPQRTPAAEPSHHDTEAAVLGGRVSNPPETPASPESTRLGQAIVKAAAQNGSGHSSHSHSHAGQQHVRVAVKHTTIDIDTKLAATDQLALAMQNAGDGPPCDICGTITVRNGTCHKCLNCGASLGCS